MQVLKFGGSSVASAANMNRVIGIVKKTAGKERVLLVVSAMGGITDTLIEAGKMAAAGNEGYKQVMQQVSDRHIHAIQELLPVQQQSATLSQVKQLCNQADSVCDGVFLLGELSARTLDKIIGFGELLSSTIVHAAMQIQGLAAHWTDSRQLIKTDSRFGHAAVNFFITNKNITDYIQQQPAGLYVAPGFVASDSAGNTTTLGRGGSDYTAAIFAAALQASNLQIWTDVSGMMTADPRIVPHAKVIPQLSYKEAMELSHFGAKVIYPPTILPVMNAFLPVWVKNTFEPEDAGTLIENETLDDAGLIRGISSMSHITLISLEGSGMQGIPGFSKRLFGALAAEKINIVLITQSSSEHSICAGIHEVDAAAAKRAVDEAFTYEIANRLLEPLKVESGLAIVALVGEKMKSHTGVSGSMFSALGRNGVNIRAIAQGSSEKNISAVISTADVKKAVNVLHEAFFETAYKQVNVFIAGAGNVGSRLLAQLQQQKQYLLDNLRVQVNIAGIANSRQALLNEDGIDLTNWKAALEEAPCMQIGEFINVIKSKNLRNSVFADVTASADVATVYGGLLEKSISVVACNKIASSSQYEVYRQLKNLAREFNAGYAFETNVGAGLPVIGTLADLLRSGDRVRKMEALLSGTLNFVFNHYDGSRSFAAVVKQAQDEGYTEPDPHLDLGGTDVMRKILILAREAGAVLEMEDVVCNGFLPASCMEGDTADFYREMEKHEAHFKQLYSNAATKGCKLKFVASFADGKASAGLQEVAPDSNFYHLYGKDNLVLFYTDRYPEQPLVIKGAGAGAEVTASGVFADIIRVAGI